MKRPSQKRYATKPKWVVNTAVTFADKLVNEASTTQRSFSAMYFCNVYRHCYYSVVAAAVYSSIISIITRTFSFSVRTMDAKNGLIEQEPTGRKLPRDPQFVERVHHWSITCVCGEKREERREVLAVGLRHVADKLVPIQRELFPCARTLFTSGTPPPRAGN